MRRRFLSALLAFCMALTLLPGTALAGYFGDTLTGDSKTLYDLLEENKDALRENKPVIKTETNVPQERGDQLTAAFPAAAYSYNYDHPELFWLQTSAGMKCTGTGSGNNWTIIFSGSIETGANWKNGKRSLEDDEKFVKEAIDKIVAAARAKSGAVEQLRYVHDWLTQNNVYNKVAATTSNYSKTDATPWSAISALDAKLSPVCEGYARAFKMACDQLGIPCIVVSGGNHMWNYVQLDGAWYGVDVTYDDPLPDQGPAYTDYTYFLVGQNTKNGEGETFAVSHQPNAGDDIKMTYPTLAKEKYDPSTAPKPVDPVLTAEAKSVVQNTKVTVDDITKTAKDAEGKNIPGKWSFAGTVSTAEVGEQTITLTFIPDDTTAYNVKTVTFKLTVTAAPVEPVDPVLTAEAKSVVQNTKVTVDDITKTAKDAEGKNIPGKWSFAGTVSTAEVGEQTITLTFIPDDTTAYNVKTVTFKLTVTAAPVEPVEPTVTVQDITVNYTGVPVADSAIRGTASVAGKWSFVGTVPTAVGVHTVTVRFTPSNTAGYLTVDKTITLTINRISQTLVITSPAAVRIDGALTLTTNSPAGLVTYTVANNSGEARIDGDVLTPLAVGTVTVTAVRAASATLDEASATQVVTIQPVPVDQSRVPSGSYQDLIITDSHASSFTIDVTRSMTFKDLFTRLFGSVGRLYLSGSTLDMSESLEVINTYDLYQLEWWPDSRTMLEITVNPRQSEDSYISINVSSGGSAVPNTRRAQPGERVILNVNPDKGYELDSLTITDTRGRQISYRSLGDNAYSFLMPNSRVSVNVDFKQSKDDTATPPEDDIYNEPFTSLGTPGISGIVLNPAAMPFTDVKGPDWFYNYVEYMWKHYLMSGTSETHFDPNVTTSRAMIWTIMARMNNVRTDINPGSTWYEKGMLWSMEKGITDGSNAMGDITREQLATMLWRNAGSPYTAGDLSRFSDADSVSAYALSAVRWAASNGILSGIDGRIDPQGTATRAQVAAMIARYGDKLVR